MPGGDDVLVADDVTPPTKTKNVAPVYPAGARAERVQGIVVLSSIIDTDGTVESVIVLTSIPELDAAAMNAVQQWEWEPRLLDGNPVRLRMTVTINFTLQ